MEQRGNRGAFVSVLLRELHRMVSRRLYIGVCVILPLFCLFFMATIFGSGQMEKIPVGVVDLDFTAASREIVRSVASVPTFYLKRDYADAAAARAATQRKEIYGYLVIPANFQRDMLGNRPTTLSYYYHYALLSVGGEVKGGFETILEPLTMSPIVATATALGVDYQTTESFLIPVKSQAHPLFNPDLDYSIYLSEPFFFILLQVIILLVTVYVVGIEIKFGTANQWLLTANMNIFIAVTAKLLPYTIIFIAMGILANYVLFGIMHIPFSCGFWPMNITVVLLIVASQALALFLFSLLPAISIVISIVSMVGSLGATLSGVTFPVVFMFPAVYYASFLFPIRHFTQISQNMLYGNYGFEYTWHNVSAMLLFVIVALLILPRLKRAIIGRKYETIE